MASQGLSYGMLSCHFVGMPSVLITTKPEHNRLDPLAYGRTAALDTHAYGHVRCCMCLCVCMCIYIYIYKGTGKNWEQIFLRRYSTLTFVHDLANANITHSTFQYGTKHKNRSHNMSSNVHFNSTIAMIAHDLVQKEM